MGPDQLSSVMQTVSGKRHSDDAEKRFAELRDRIEKESEALYSTARLWVSSPRVRVVQNADV